MVNAVNVVRMGQYALCYLTQREKAWFQISSLPLTSCRSWAHGLASGPQIKHEISALNGLWNLRHMLESS